MRELLDEMPLLKTARAKSSRHGAGRVRDSQVFSRDSLLKLFLLPGRAEHEAEIDRAAHRRVARAVRMQLVAWHSCRRIRLKFRLEFARREIERRGIEIDHAVENT